MLLNKPSDKIILQEHCYTKRQFNSYFVKQIIFRYCTAGSMLPEKMFIRISEWHIQSARKTVANVNHQNEPTLRENAQVAVEYLLLLRYGKENWRYEVKITSEINGRRIESEIIYLQIYIKSEEQNASNENLW